MPEKSTDQIYIKVQDKRPLQVGAIRGLIAAAVVAAIEAAIKFLPSVDVPGSLALFIPVIVLALRAGEAWIDEHDSGTATVIDDSLPPVPGDEADAS